jgi:hypothetical protein
VKSTMEIMQCSEVNSGKSVQKLGQVFNLAPGAKLLPRGELCPLGVKLSLGVKVLCSPLHSPKQLSVHPSTLGG